jgi:hypothetical protein
MLDFRNGLSGGEQTIHVTPSKPSASQLTDAEALYNFVHKIFVAEA